jgi:putative FmdB family regulatory protein
MPLYEYQCETCGIFEQWRTLAQVSTPMLCPTCQAVAKRVFSAPNVNLNSGRVQLHNREAKEPRVVQRSQTHNSEAPKYSQQSNGRPWMISH